MMKNIKSIKYLNTDRLTIGLPDITDAPFFLELLNTPDWLRYIGDKNVKSVEDAKDYILTLSFDPNRTYWVVRITDGKIPIGMVSMIQRDYLDHPDFGFAFLPAYYKMGYAYEAASNALDTLFSDYHFNTILAIALKENMNSGKLLKKLGFQLSEEVLREGEIVNYYTLSHDKHCLDRLVHQFFNLFNNKNNVVPALESIFEICIPEAIIIKKTGLQSIVYHLQSFIEPRKKILSDGTLTDFEEMETNEETKIIHHIAHRYSTYRKSGMMIGEPYHGTGHKLFQFINSDGGWKISALIWEDDG